MNLIAPLFLATATLASPNLEPTNLVCRWHEALLEVMVIAENSPPVISKNLAILSTAQFDAVNAIEGKFNPYRYKASKRSHDASREAAIIGASITMIRSVYTARQNVPNRLAAAQLAQLGNDPSVQNGFDIGVAAAKTILESRSNDGSLGADFVYNSQNRIGEYRNPINGDLKLPTPAWGRVKPFCLPNGDHFRPQPVSMESQAYAFAIEDLQRLGGKNSLERTPEEEKIAKFWYFGNHTVTPPGAWNQIAIKQIEQKKLGLYESARLMALLNIALADVGVAAWDCKYHYVFWRPIDAIRNADLDNNSYTVADPNWEPFLPTPNHPSFVSGHSAFSMAAATILTRFFGDNVRFSYRGDPKRSMGDRFFDGFYQAAREAGRSRIYAGIHFQFDNLSGLELGEKVAKAVLEMELRPL